MNRIVLSASRRSGLTLVEVLVVIAIIAVLVALLIPAVQGVRHAANLIQCRNNLKQIGLAAHAYDSVNGGLPPGSVGVPNRYWYVFQMPQVVIPQAAFETPHLSVLAFLLPYLEQENVYQMFFKGADPMPLDSFSVTTTETKAWWQYDSGLEAAKIRIPVFYCPEDDIQNVPVIDGDPFIWWTTLWAADDFGGHGGMQSFIEEDQPVPEIMYSRPDELGRTNYPGCQGYAGRLSLSYARELGFAGDYEGLLCARSKVSLAMVSAADGTGNTLLFGESVGVLNVDGTRGETRTWLGASSLDTKIGLGEINKQFPDIPVVYLHQFSSFHSAVVNFCFADGSVRGIRRNADQDTFTKYMAGWNDGMMVDNDLVE